MTESAYFSDLYSIMNSIPVKKLEQLNDIDIIVIPCVKQERKKSLKFIETCEANLRSAWSGTAIQLIHDHMPEPGKAIVQWAGRQRVILIGIDESASYQKISSGARSILFKALDNAEMANTIAIIPAFLKRKSIAAFTNGLSMAYLRLDYYKHDKKEYHGSLTFFPEKPKDITQVLGPISEGLTLADIQKDICRLVNLPSNEKNPLYIVNWARERFNGAHYAVHVLDQAALKDQGLDALINVGKGSKTPPYLLVIRYDKNGVHGNALSKANKGKGKKGKHLGLIGKGVTFDTGGISLKDPLNMHLMKSDMGGAAAVLGVMDLIGSMRWDIQATAVIPLAENAIGPDAYRPGDVISSYSGRSIEVIDTDAEGRLILADAIAYMVKNYKPDIMIDFATLTGSIITTLGYKAAGLFSNNDDLAKSLQRAADHTGERLWRLPLWDEYQDEMNSDIADIKNLATKPLAGAITAAKFLEYFTESHPAWAHIDIAGVAMMDTEYGKQRNATAYGVLLLKQWIEDLIK
jgi:leucyl aminopeptidase